MNRIDIFKAFRIQGFLQIFFTDAVYTMPAHLFPALIDEHTVLIKRFGFNAVFGNIASDELNGSGRQFYLSIAVAFTQDDQRTILRIEIVKVKRCDFTRPGTGVLKQMKNGVVTKAVFFLWGQRNEKPSGFHPDKESR